MSDGEPACRRGSVHRSLAGFRMGGHPSVRPTWECRRAGRPLHAWPCSGWGLPSRPGRPGRWCALTAPFHPHLCARLGGRGHRRSVLCGTFLRVAPTGCEPASFPAEPRPSSAPPRGGGAAATRPAHRRTQSAGTERRLATRNRLPKDRWSRAPCGDGVPGRVRPPGISGGLRRLGLAPDRRED